MSRVCNVRTGICRAAFYNNVAGNLSTPLVYTELVVQCTKPGADLRKKADKKEAHTIAILPSSAVIFRNHGNASARTLDMVSAIMDTDKLCGCYLAARMLVRTMEESAKDSLLLSYRFNRSKTKKDLLTIGQPFVDLLQRIVIVRKERQNLRDILTNYYHRTTTSALIGYSSIPITAAPEEVVERAARVKAMLAMRIESKIQRVRKRLEHRIAKHG